MTYQLLSHAIHYADLGLLRQAIRECYVIFQAKSGGKHAYARECIRQLHVIDSEAATKEFQDAILINCLVNVDGHKGRAFETDRLLELHNLVLPTFFREKGSSSLPVEDLLAQCSLTGPCFDELTKKMRYTFAAVHSNRHSPKAASEDILSVAKELASKGLAKRSALRVDGRRFSAHSAADLFNEGLLSLSINVGKYNTKVLYGMDDDDGEGNEDLDDRGDIILDDDMSFSGSRPETPTSDGSVCVRLLSLGRCKSFDIVQDWCSYHASTVILIYSSSLISLAILASFAAAASRLS
ncbi:MAG: hypothetical protein MMC33_010889 [Icmadophila ericetorum]|nr:hypothetical protein [Icmadophila ericetorum]